jgi:hypothetical protein
MCWFIGPVALQWLRGPNLGGWFEDVLGCCIHLVGVAISFERNFYRLPFSPPSLVASFGPSQSNKERSLPPSVHWRDAREVTKPRLLLLSQWILGVQSLSPYGFIVTIVGEMVTRVSFASRGSVRREWQRSGLTRTSTTLPIVYLSLVCRCPGPRRLWERFQLGEIKRWQVVLLTEPM